MSLNVDRSQPNITNTKISAYRISSSSINQFIEYINDNYSQSSSQATYIHPKTNNIEEIRIMHSKKLKQIQGIQRFSKVTKMNLSCNIIEYIEPIKYCKKLQVLDLNGNNILSLQGIQQLQHLVKLDISNNKILSIEPLNKLSLVTNRLSTIYFQGNNISNLEEVYNLKNLNKLNQIVFRKSKSTNPICQIQEDYLKKLAEVFRKDKLENLSVDGKKLSQYLKEIQNYQYYDHQNQQSNNFYNRTGINPQRFQHSLDRSPHHQMTQGHRNLSQNSQNYPNSQPLHFTQPYHHPRLLEQTEQLLFVKTELLEELKSKALTLEHTQTLQATQLHKKQSQINRFSEENIQLHKIVDKKQKNLNELHKRIQDLLKSSGETQKTIQIKNKQIEKLKQQMNDLKISFAEVNAIQKNTEDRYRTMQQKTFQAMSERTLKQAETGKRHQQLYEENKQLMRDKQDMKQRIRELSELLREWEYKYQNKVSELEAKAGYEKEEMLKQAEHNLLNTGEHYQQQFQQMDSQMRRKVEEIESTYKKSLEDAYEKHKKLKGFADERVKTQNEMKIVLKSALDKNNEQQTLIQQFQEMMMKLKNEYAQCYEQKQHKTRELNQIKYKYAQDYSSLQQKLNRANYERNRYQKQLSDIKQSNIMLQNDMDKYSQKQKLLQDIQHKYEDLQTQIEVKNTMLDDKNESLQSLKIEVETLQKQLEGKVQRRAYDEMKKKYEKYKGRCEQLSSKTQEIIQESEELRRENEDFKEIAGEFENMQATLKTYEKAVEQKDGQLTQLMRYVQECKRMAETSKTEAQQWKRQVRRVQTQAQRKQKGLRQQLREMDKYKGQLQRVKEQSEKQRQKAVDEMQSFINKFK